MSLSTDLRIREQLGFSALTPGGVDAVSNNSFSQVLSTVCQASGSTRYESYFQAASSTYQVPADLLKAVAKVESDFTPDAVSSCGAQGIMQLMPDTARYLGVTDSFDPAQNIMGGAKYLRQMLDRFDGDVSCALAAYNAGPGAVEKCGGVPQNIQNYVNKVLGYAGEGVSIPARTVSAESAGFLTQDELTDLIFQMYRPSGVQNLETMRLLVRQLFLKDEEDAWEI